MKPFRYLLDPLFLTCVALYFLNRILLRPHFPWPFLHQHLNDALCIPFWLPLMLCLQRVCGLRAATGQPTTIEILIPTLVWSWLFEIVLPGAAPWNRWCVADPYDVLCYMLGAAGAGLFWRWWYQSTRRASRQELSTAAVGRDSLPANITSGSTTIKFANQGIGSPGTAELSEGPTLHPRDLPHARYHQNS